MDIFYLDSPCADYVKGCVETAIKIHEKEPPGDILIFLTGMEEVDHCSNLLKNYSDTARDSKHGLKMWISPMYGALAPAKQLKALRPAGKGFRKIVVATNIAETSITIEGVGRVVFRDWGFLNNSFLPGFSRYRQLFCQTGLLQQRDLQQQSDHHRGEPGLCRTESWQGRQDQAW